MRKITIFSISPLIWLLMGNYYSYRENENKIYFDYPVKDSNLYGNLRWEQSQKFGDYYRKMGGYHSGEDWNLIGGRPDADLGKPIYAIAKGKVVKISPLKSNLGYLIALEHIALKSQTFIIPEKKTDSYYYKKDLVNKIYSVYVHVKPERGIGLGVEVEKGQIIGYITDISPLSPHLHFEIRHPETKSSGDWSMVGDSDNWARVDNKITGYYINPQKMVNAGLRSPIDFINANKHANKQEELISWKEYRLGTLSYSIPPDWKLWHEGDALRKYYKDELGKIQYISLGGIQRMYYTEKDQIGFIISVTDEERGIESGKVRIVHSDECGGKRIEEPVMMPQRTIYISHMGCLVDSFKTEVAGYPVMVCILREGRSVSSTYWTFTLIRSGKRYIFHLTCANPEYQREIFRQLTSRIRFLS